MQALGVCSLLGLLCSIKAGLRKRSTLQPDVNLKQSQRAEAM